MSSLNASEPTIFARFRNEVLGLPVSLGDHIVTREQLEACCTNKPMAQSLRTCRSPSETTSSPASIGVAAAPPERRSWLGSRDPTGCSKSAISRELVAGKTLTLSKVRDRNLSQIQVRWIGADGLGNGSVYNRLLLDGIDTPLTCMPTLIRRPTRSRERASCGNGRSAGPVRSATSSVAFKNKILFPRWRTAARF